MKIAVASDHRGFALKEQIKEQLQALGHEVNDFGTDSDQSCDYPDYGAPAARALALQTVGRAILICGTGIGMTITANKVIGVRAALCHDEVTAEISRRHNNSNALCLPADMLDEDHTRRIVEAWLRTDFENGGRHTRRLGKIKIIEDKMCEK